MCVYLDYQELEYWSFYVLGSFLEEGLLWNAGVHGVSDRINHPEDYSRNK